MAVSARRSDGPALRPVLLSDDRGPLLVHPYYGAHRGRKQLRNADRGHVQRSLHFALQFRGAVESARAADRENLQVSDRDLSNFHRVSSAHPSGISLFRRTHFFGSAALHVVGKCLKIII